MVYDIPLQCFPISLNIYMGLNIKGQSMKDDDEIWCFLVSPFDMVEYIIIVLL